MTGFRQDQSARDVALDGLKFMIFAPVDIWTSGLAGAVDNVRGLDIIQDLTDFTLTLHSDGRGVNWFALPSKKVFHVARDQPFLSPN